MAQETFYFPHDYNPLVDPKLKAMISVHGGAGYGVYWRLVEMLHNNEKHELPLTTYLYMSVGHELCLTKETIKDIIESCIEMFELFKSDGENFWSERVFRNIEKRKEISQKRSKAGKESAKARKEIKGKLDEDNNSTCVEHMLTSVEQMSTKERKGKERKEKKRKEEVLC